MGSERLHDHRRLVWLETTDGTALIIWRRDRAVPVHILKRASRGAGWLDHDGKFHMNLDATLDWAESQLPVDWDCRGTDAARRRGQNT